MGYGGLKGKHAFVELVDQDDSGSYAVAAGRFSSRV